METKLIRQKFLEYFKKHGHQIVRSSSLVPHDDPTLLFTNAGMNQFKNVFLGLEKRDFLRATSSQKCVRAGGKHNDLENVGYTSRHHTFFEMLGNFSFGDYSKLGAIKFAWDFLTNELKILPEKLYVTVYHTDDATYNVWHNEIGLDPSRIIRIGDKPDGSSDNFWQMGETGPCGPCTEIFYDHGESVAGGLPGSANEDGDRYIEIWNCVFMEFNLDVNGFLHALPATSVDTGMGLERISAVMQNVHSNYEIDLFIKLIDATKQIVKFDDSNSPSLKVIADHIRSISFLIADGVLPSNEGRGYVLRRIIRRAIRHGYKLGCRDVFLYKLVQTLVDLMGDSYPELIVNQEQIEKVIRQEELKFFQTIENGMKLLESELAKISNGILAGDVAFKLYDTYGFPLDLTQDICREHRIKIDMDSFDKCMDQQKATARSHGKFKMNSTVEYAGCNTRFIGYNESNTTARVVALYKNGNSVDQLTNGDKGIIVLDYTPFYAESGGQAGDVGVIQVNGGADAVFTVDDTQKIRDGVIGHFGSITHGLIQVGEIIVATIDLHKRIATARNHSATHLLHKALHEVVGVHAVQKGSSVTSNYTRFDFANDRPLTIDQINEIEQIVNRVIMHNYSVIIDTMSYDEALKAGAVALFGEKYSDFVRVIKIGDFSIELCGGTHIARTGDIGLFKIVSESGIANGVRRIEAITGEVAVSYLQNNMAILNQVRDQLKSPDNQLIPGKIDVLHQDIRTLNKEISNLKDKMSLLQINELIDRANILPNGIKLLSLQVDGLEIKDLQNMVAKFKDKLVSNSVIVIGSIVNDRVNLIVGITQDLVSKHKAGDLINKLTSICGGKGGGRPELAQAGGGDVSKLSLALSNLSAWIGS